LDITFNSELNRHRIREDYNSERLYYWNVYDKYTQLREFSVITKNNQHILRLTLLELDWHCVSVDAEVCFWQWHRGKQIQILQVKID